MLLKPNIIVLTLLILCGIIVSPINAGYWWTDPAPPVNDNTTYGWETTDAVKYIYIYNTTLGNLSQNRVTVCGHPNCPTNGTTISGSFNGYASFIAARSAFLTEHPGSIPDRVLGYSGDGDHGDWAYVAGNGTLTPVSSFTCTPTSQFPDEDVVCTDTSSNTPTNWYWTITAESLGQEGFLADTQQNFTWASHYPGLYSVNLWANNSAGGDWENKSAYVSISENATPNNCLIPPLEGYIRTNFQCTDANSEAAISGCNIQLHDLEGGAWSNATSVDSGTWCIDTLPYHHINGYGDATGYTDGTRLNAESWNGQTYTILMIPGYTPSAQEGYVWVYVHVTKFGTATDLEGVYVSLSGSGLTTKSDYTNAAGVAMMQWPNASTAYVNAVKPGYTTGIKVFTTSDFGPDFVDIALHAGTHTLTIVPTTGPGGTVPTTIVPCDSNFDGVPDDPGYSNTQAQMWMNWLALNGFNLIQLCFLVTVLALLGVRLGK